MTFVPSLLMEIMTRQFLAGHCVTTFGHWKTEKPSRHRNRNNFPDEKPILVTDVECSHSAALMQHAPRCLMAKMCFILVVSRRFQVDLS
jgi:hypothetical protein